MVSGSATSRKPTSAASWLNRRTVWKKCVPLSSKTTISRRTPSALIAQRQRWAQQKKSPAQRKKSPAQQNKTARRNLLKPRPEKRTSNAERRHSLPVRNRTFKAHSGAPAFAGSTGGKLSGSQPFYRQKTECLCHAYA